MDFKNIHIGILINQRVEEMGIEIQRICNFLKCSEKEIEEMYKAKSLDTEMLLRWSKLLEYDYFRVYTQHLILFAPSLALEKKESSKISSLPQFRKNIYTKEIINFILESIRSNEITAAEAIKRYQIPKTTLYKWLSKYND